MQMTSAAAKHKECLLIPYASFVIGRECDERCTKNVELIDQRPFFNYSLP